MSLRLLALEVALVLAFVSPTARADEEGETRRLARLAIERLLDGQARIMRIADRVRLAGAPFCDGLAPVVGVFSADDRTFRDRSGSITETSRLLSSTAAEMFALERRPTVLLVVPGLAADLAGVKPGDRVTRIDGKKVRRKDRLDVLRGKGRDGTLRWTVQRGESTEVLELEVQMGCPYPSRFWYGTDVNAFATHFGDLTGLYVIGGMLELLKSDDELAILVGHELAHLILEHTTMDRTIERFEADADYLGMYLAARAGYDVAVAPGLWDLFASRNPYSGIDWGFYRHPSSAKRSLALQATLDEIRGKVERGQSLVPERSE